MNAETADAVLRVLGEHLGRDVRFSRGPKRMSGGAFSAVYAFRVATEHGPDPRPLVLRTFPAGTDPIQPRREQIVQDGVADAGFPAPRVLAVQCDPTLGGEMFLVMERLAGHGFLRGVRWDQFARSFPRVMARWPQILVEVAQRLHAADASSVLNAADAHGIDRTALSLRRHVDFVETRFASFGGSGVSAALAWLGRNEPAPPRSPSVAHGDLWPANVLVRRRRLTGLVDWDRAGVGDPALDIGFACAGLALMPAPFPPPPPISQAVGAAGRNLAQRAKRAYVERAGIPIQRVEFYEALRCLLELAVLLEHRRLADQGIDRAKPPWANGSAALRAHFATITGVPVSID